MRLLKSSLYAMIFFITWISIVGLSSILFDISSNGLVIVGALSAALAGHTTYIINTLKGAANKS